MRKRDRIVLIGILVVGFLAIFMFRPAAISFSDLTDAKVRIRAKGYFCKSDAINPGPRQGFLVTRHALSRDEVNEMCKVGRMGPQWKGKVWVTSRSSVETMPDEAASRVWGRVLVYGDRELLDELEGKLQRSHFSML